MSKKENFLNKITGNVSDCWSKYGILPSVMLSQAILESGWGESQLTQKANNLFGIKADSSWKGDFYTIQTAEYVNGKKIYVDAKFRKYNNWNESIVNHAQFINANKRYSKIIGNNDYKDVCKLLRSCGYATNPDYANLLISVIESNNLTQFDKTNNKEIIKDVKIMINATTTCRDVSELSTNAQVAIKLLFQECHKAGIRNIFVTETYRSQARQDYLYAQGRTRAGQIVTWTRNSNHKSRLAWDIAVSPPQSLYDVKTLTKVGNIAKKLGITWGGFWKDNLDMPHFEIKSNWTMPKGYKLEGNVIIPTNSKEKVQLVLNKSNKDGALSMSEYKELKKEIEELRKQLNNVEKQPSSWAKESWEFGKDNGITDGSSPRNLITREQVMSMLHRFYKLIKK